MANTLPKITVIVAVFNGVRTISQCLDSIVQQNYPDKEIIVIDGGSTDGTVNLLKNYKLKIDYLVSEPDQGIYNAWNKGLAQAHGDWICFLGSDDYLWDLNVLEKMAERLALIPSNILVAYGQIMLLSSDDRSLYTVGKPWEVVKKRFKHEMSVPHPGLAHHRSLFKLHGVFNESFHIVGDYELLLRELKCGDAAFMSDIIVAGMRQGGISSNPKLTLTSLYEVRRAQLIHGARFPYMLWIMAIVRVYIRLLLWKVLGESITRKLLDLARRAFGLPAYWTKT